MQKKITYNWHLVGILPIVFGTIYYIYNIINHVAPWNFLWVCPATAVLAGFFVLLKNRFGMSASIIWVCSGPLLVILFELKKSLQFWQFYHIFSVIVVLFILYHLKETWNSKGFVFGQTTFYAYTGLTSYFSKGEINFVCQWWGVNKIILYLGLFFLILSVALLIWDFVEKKYMVK